MRSNKSETFHKVFHAVKRGFARNEVAKNCKETKFWGYVFQAGTVFAKHFKTVVKSGTIWVKPSYVLVGFALAI